MAWNFNGGTDQLRYNPGSAFSAGTFSFWIRTTQTTSNVCPVSHWSTTSRNGFGFLLNNSANKITVQAWSGSANRVNLVSTTSINDGNPHHIAYFYGIGSGNGNYLFIDGVQETSGAASGAWSITATNAIALGDNVDTFWASPVCDIWDVAHWGGAQLPSGAVEQLARGFSPKQVNLNDLVFYTPLVRDTHELTFGVPVAAVSGGSVVPGGRMMGAAV